MKKIFASVFALILLISCLFAGGALAEEKRIRIVATIFPIYDWARQLVGEDAANAEITLLLDNGVDLHSYQPTAQDILKVATADLFIYVGGESDEWVADVLAAADHPDLNTISLVEAMGEDIKLEELVEGMEHEDDHDEDEEHEHDEADEHVWLSLRNAQKLVNVIADALAQIDPDSGARYAANADAYAEKLSALDARYAEVLGAAAFQTVLFGDRFPFRYLTDDYGLSYYAAFSGCSAETEASFQTVVFLAQKVDELNLPAVLTIENPKARIAETIVEATAAKDQKILALDSMQGTTLRDAQAGASYLSIMESNLSVLQDALN